MQEKENNSFSRKVRMLRLDYGLTQPDLAKLMDVSVRTVASWESGKKRKHEVMLWDQIQKKVGSKAKKTVEAPRKNTEVLLNPEAPEEEEMYRTKFEEAQHEIITLLKENALLKEQLLGKRQPSSAKKRKTP